MDIRRPRDVRSIWWRRGLYGGSIALVISGASVGLARVRPAAPTVESASVWSDTVRRGEMLRQVRGLGSLVPEDLRWVAAPSQGRVERVLVQPGSTVTPDTMLLELSNPQLEQEAEEAVLKLRAAEATLANLRIQVQNETLQQQGAMAVIAAEHRKAAMQAEMNEALAARQLVSELSRRQSQLDAEQWALRERLAREQLGARDDAGIAQVAIQQSAVDQARAMAALKARQRDDLRVRAGIAGVLQSIAVDVGQQVSPGTSLARVANPGRLKALLKVGETQAKDVQVGQPAIVDTHNGTVNGRVGRIDPGVESGTRSVDIVLEGPLPKGAVPDLSVDGVIELERLEQVLFVGRPAFGQEHNALSLFRVDADGSAATRVVATLGRGSVSTVEIVDGLREGDRVILSDMSAWDGVDRVRLK